MNRISPPPLSEKVSSPGSYARLFLIHWNESEAREYASNLTRKNYHVDVEFANGGRAVKSIKDNPPNVVVIFMSRMPSHGRQTVLALQKDLKTRNIPLILVDCKMGEAGRIKREFRSAWFVSSSDLVRFLDSMGTSAE